MRPTTVGLAALLAALTAPGDAHRAAVRPRATRVVVRRAAPRAAAPNQNVAQTQDTSRERIMTFVYARRHARAARALGDGAPRGPARATACAPAYSRWFCCTLSRARAHPLASCRYDGETAESLAIRKRKGTGSGMGGDKLESDEYDTIVIGSGVGGLACGALSAKYGDKVRR
jgi:hypothetical protein